MTVMGSPHHEHEVEAVRQWPGRVPSATEELFASVSYFGAIIIIPVIPLIIYLVGRPTSQFVRWHAATALNIALTMLLYAISATIMGVMLSFDSRITALAVMIPIALAGWGVMISHLVRCADAAKYGEWRQVPAWICAELVK
jgi:uncharacterized Tic20 family protein